jgi:hypothetical protein
LRWKDAAEQIESALRQRGAILDGLMRGSVEGDAPFVRLRDAMRRHEFPASGKSVSLRKLVDNLDARCRREGLHVMQAWDFKAHRFSADPAPALLVDHCARLQRKADTRTALAILLDVYFYHVLSLLAARAWDEGDAGSNLDRVTLLIHLARQEGSGLAYVDDAETLLFLAASYFHPDEGSYELLLDRVRALPRRQQVRMAQSSGAMLSAHLRWGFRYMYGRDIQRMRDDNAADYPWVHFAVETLAASPESDDALLVALAADPWGTVPRLADARDSMKERFAALQPKRGEFSPLSVTFNFPSNASVALVASTIEDGRCYPSLNALFTCDSGAAGAELAERLMKYSASEPSRLGAGEVPLVVYNSTDGARAHNAVMRELV